VWASVWNPRAWEEREYWGISHTDVGMALLVNPTYDNEQANGVAITANLFDTSGLEPAFYINVQQGEASVVLPEEGVTTDQILYYYQSPGQPVVYIRHSNLVPAGETVLSNAELYELGTALAAIHAHFLPAYGRSGGFYAMDTEFKITEDGRLEVKQARPYPGWQAD
jgi:phosphoenolpyruvate synthase/pyruvate phosphate dikinase